MFFILIGPKLFYLCLHVSKKALNFNCIYLYVFHVRLGGVLLVSMLDQL